MLLADRQKKLKVFLATYSYKDNVDSSYLCGPSLDLFNYLKTRVKKIIYLEQPDPLSSDLTPQATIYTDGFLKKKGKRLRNSKAPDDLETIKETIKNFIKDQKVKVKNIPEFQKACPIDFNDDSLELVPEVYLDGKEPTTEEIEEEMEHLMRETVSYLIRTKEKTNEDNR